MKRADRINELQITKLGFDDRIRALEAEVGPIKYVAKLFQDLGASEIALDKAVAYGHSCIDFCFRSSCSTVRF